jgi:hypothetical protein
MGVSAGVGMFKRNGIWYRICIGKKLLIFRALWKDGNLEFLA